MDNRFRYIDPDGSETVVAGIPELINEICKGKVLAATMLFDSAQQRWISASQHDAFQTATAMMAAAAIGVVYPPNDPVVIEAARQSPPVLPQPAQPDLSSSTADSALERELQSLDGDFTAAVARGIEPGFLRKSYQSQLRQIHALHGASAPVVAGATTADQINNPVLRSSEEKERSNHRGLKAYDDYYPMRASAGQRFAGFLIDLVFIYAMAFAAGLALVASGMTALLENANDYVVGLTLFLIYFVPQEGITGKTLGKRICGTVAVQSDGTPLSIGIVVGRTLCRFIPFEAFSFLGDDGYPRGWHDRITNTQVLASKKVRAAAAHSVDDPQQNTT